MGQLIFEFVSQLYQYPNHQQFIEYLEGFLENVKYYEEYESKKVIGICSTVKQYYDEAEQLLDEG